MSKGELMKHSQEGCGQSMAAQNEVRPDKKLHRNDVPNDESRRAFLGKVGIGGATAVALAAGVSIEPLIAGKDAEAEASVAPYRSNNRANDSFNYRKNTAINEKINNGELPDNGDAERFTDFSGSWSKCLKHEALGIVNPASWLSLVHAMQTGRFSDFQNIQVGNPGGPGFTGTLNGPMGALAFDLEGLDAFVTVIPPHRPWPVRRLLPKRSSTIGRL